MKSPRILLSIVSSMILLLTASAPCSAQDGSVPPITVKIVNNSSVDPSNVYVLLTHTLNLGDSVTGIEFNTPTKLSSITNGEFTTTQLTSGRIIFSYYGPVDFDQNPNNPSVRFDKVELTYPGAANLTAVDFFGIPFKLQSLDTNSNVLQTLAYYTSTHTLVPLLTALAPSAVVQTTCPATPGCTAGSFARVLSPSVLSPTKIYYPSMQPYVDSVKGKTVTIAGTYEGHIGPTPNTYNYTGTFSQDDGSITLSGTMTAGSPKTLKVDGSTLAAAIYTINGSYTVDNILHQVSDNDVYAAIYRDLVSGFGFGYVGGKYGPNSNAWYGTTPYNPPYACARSTNDGFFNQYASVIAANSDAYGFPFSDVNQPVQVGLNSGGTGHVDTLQITILPDDMLDTPIITAASSTDNSITIGWPAISGATGYKVSVSPPLVANIIDAGTSTSITIHGLNPGTPYTVSVTAYKGASSSGAIPISITTTGSPTVVAVDANSVGWNFIPNFTGTFTGHTITFNGCTQTLKNQLNPAINFSGIPGEMNAQNAYVFEWKDALGALVYSSVLYVNLNGQGTNGGAPSLPCQYGGSGGPHCYSPSAPLCFGIINQNPTQTFMAANQHTPTYDPPPNAQNLYLSIAPVGQRKFCQATYTLSDLNSDGVVGGADLTLLLAAWGACSAAPAPCIEDLNSDGFVTGADLAMMIAEWGTNQN